MIPSLGSMLDVLKLLPFHVLSSEFSRQSALGLMIAQKYEMVF